MSKEHVILKTPAQIALARQAGKLAADVLEMIAPHVKPGVSTEELDRICHDYIVDVQKAIPANVGYHGFPKTICTSVNHVICHGIPSRKKVLKDGDIINIDVTIIKDGWHGDTSRMYYAGRQGCGAAPGPRRPSTRCGPAFARCGRAHGWATSATPSRA